MRMCESVETAARAGEGYFTLGIPYTLHANPEKNPEILKEFFGNLEISGNPHEIHRISKSFSNAPLAEIV